MSANDKNSIMSRHEDIERLVRLSTLHYTKAGEFYREAQECTRKQMALPPYDPRHDFIEQAHHEAKQKGDDHLREAAEMDSRIKRARECFKADFSPQGGSQ